MTEFKRHLKIKEKWMCFDLRRTLGVDKVLDFTLDSPEVLAPKDQSPKNYI